MTTYSSLRPYLRIILLPLLLLGIFLVGIIQASGNVGAANPPVVSDAFHSAPIVSDDFNACELNEDLWTTVYRNWNNRYKLSGEFSGDAYLTISVDDSDRHTISETNTKGARILQPAPDTDFEIITKFGSQPSETYQMQGILVSGSEYHHYMRFEFYFSRGNMHLYAGVLAGEHFYEQADLLIPAPDPGKDMYLRVKRDGDTWTLTYSYDGTTWLPQPAVSFNYPLNVEAVGVWVGNSAGGLELPPPYTAEVDYFFNYESPIVSEDGGVNDLVINVVGDGVATKEPDKPSYACGERVELTAIPGEHWQFDAWSGDFSSGEDTESAQTEIRMNAHREITATFALANLELTVNTDGSGSVEQEPPPPYVFNDRVRLTAVPDVGWDFYEWGGAASGMMNPVTVTMISDLTVTATFTVAHHTLTVGTDGNGTVDISPQKTDYLHGETVWLTPKPNDGSSFSGWGGPNAVDLVDEGAGAYSLDMDEDKFVIATFIQDEYTLDITITRLDGGTGRVDVSPQQSSYHYGDQVRLRAVPLGRSYFDGWGGDLSGSDPQQVISIVGNLEVEARFGPREYFNVFLPIVHRDR